MGSIELGLMPSEAQWSEFFNMLSPTPASASTNFDKICVVVRQRDEISGMCYHLYCIDLSSGCMDNDYYFKTLHPTLEFPSDHGNYLHHEFVVVGSRLFMFGGLDLEDHVWSGYWSYYDFSSVMYTDKITLVKEEDLKFGPPMEGRKYEPIAAVIGGYKLCVFATLLYDKNQAERGYPLCKPPNFEVFNTVNWSWTELDEPVVNYSECGLDKIYIRSHSIVGSCLIICTDIGIYGINIDFENPKWVKMEGSGRIEGGPLSGRWAVVGKNICNPFEVMRFGEAQSCPFEFETKGSLRPDIGIGVLLSERLQNGDILCSVRGSMSGSHVPALFVNVVKFDSELLENMRGDKWKKIQSDKSSVYAAIESGDCRSIVLLGVFQLKETKQEMEQETEEVRAVRKKASEDERRSKMGYSILLFASVIAVLFFRW